jgi:hypothetical protein
MPHPDKCELLADKIGDLFSHGIPLSAGMVHYIDSTFGNPSIEALQAILADDSDCERETLVELLLFPDEALQLQFEDLFEKYEFTQQDQARVVDRVGRHPLHARFQFHDSRPDLVLPMAAAAVACFVSRLRITKTLNPRITEAIAKYVHPNLSKICRVKLRNSNFAEKEQNIKFLCAFFKKIPADSRAVLPYLDFVFGLLEENKKGSNMLELLTARKKHYLKAFQSARRLEQRLQRNTVETLLLQGERITCENEEDALDKIAMIDTIARAVFGRTQDFDQPLAGESCMDLRIDKKVEN